MNASPLLHKVRDRLTLYLPLLVMLVLALGSWWLVRSMPDLWGVPKDKVVRKDPDYNLRQFVVKVFDAQGRQVREVMGDEGRHYPDTDELHIEQVTFKAQTENGQHLNAVGRNGIATGDGERVTLLGDASAVREATDVLPRIELRGEKIVALIKAEKLLSSDPVQITRGADVFTANNMDFDIQSGHYLLSGRVRGTLAPSPSGPKP
jgi:lipopolysaccharide export system protein LptC